MTNFFGCKTHFTPRYIFKPTLNSSNHTQTIILPNTFQAIVIKSTGSWYSVQNAEDATLWRCRLRGALRLAGSRSTNPVVVGDRVLVERGQTSDDAVIVEILPRTNYIIRRASNLSKESHILAANIDRVYIVATVDEPVTSPEFIDRVLVTAEAYRIPATIVFNKTDLHDSSEYALMYLRAGYDVLEISATEGAGVAQLREMMRGRTSLLTGNSGVGKSTLINAIDPRISARVGDISAYHGKGMHTTTFSEIFALSGGGFIIDTPGVKGFGLVEIEKNELYRYFRELMLYSAGCGFYNCTHTHEPNCAVVQAVREEKIHLCRYESYLKMLEDENSKHRK